MKASAKFNRARVSHAADHDVHLVVNLTAPRIEAQAKRPPICIIPAIDVSPSMSGEKFHYAKQSLLKLVDNLQPGDYCGLVQFAGDAQVLLSPCEVTQSRKDELKARVGSLSIGSATNIADAILKGCAEAAKMDLPAGTIVRVIIFTDGQPNTGPATDQQGLVRLLTGCLGNATLSAFGYGSDANQDLLSALARVGKGNYAFIKNPDDALSAFAKELGGLVSTYAQSIEVEIEAKTGHKVTKVISDVDVEDRDGKILVKIPSILGEESRDLVLAVRLSKQDCAGPRAVNAFQVRVSYDHATPDGKVERLTCETLAKVQFCKPEDHQKDPDPDVEKIVGLAQMVEAQIEAERLANRGDYAAATNYMADFSLAAQRRGLVGVAGAAQKIGSRMRSRTAYDAGSGYLRSTKNAGTRAYGASSLDHDARADLENLGVQLNNDAQDAMIGAFTGGSTPAAPQPDFAQALKDQLDLAKSDPDFSIVAPMPNPHQGTAAVHAAVSPPPAKGSLTKSRSKRW